MKKLLILVSFVLLLIAIGLYSCIYFYRSINAISVAQTTEYIRTNPKSTPPYISNISNSTKLLCITIWQRPLWALGNSPDALTKQITDTFILKINNIEISRKYISVEQANSEIFIFDGRNIIGKYQGNITFCVNIEHLRGAFLAEIRLTTLSNIEYTYSWIISSQ